MMDDFKRPPERRPARMDGFRGDGLPRRDYSLPPGQPSHGNENELDFRNPEKYEHDHPQHFLPPLEHHAELAAIATPDEPQEARQKKRFGFFRKPNLTKKQWILAGAALLVLIGGGATFALTREEPKPVVKAPAKVAPKPPPPPPILSPLTGLPVTEAQKSRPVTGVMIENSANARPQSGLDQAGVVFEAIAEYGITRFLALYQETEPGNLGPVRSARPYFLDWNLAFDANYAHVGGSPEALQLISGLGVRDLDQFYNSGAYHRIDSRFAPHNMYTNMPALNSAAANRGFGPSTFTPLVRKEKESPSKTPTAKVIDFNISGAFYNVHYDYDPATNSYKRVMGGSPHLEAETGAQLSPKVVIALGIPYSLQADGYHSNYSTIGSGNMLLFQDGVVTAGTWAKAGHKDQFIFKDGAGTDMKLNPGQTWITALGDISQATYGP